MSDRQMKKITRCALWTMFFSFVLFLFMNWRVMAEEVVLEESEYSDISYDDMSIIPLFDTTVTITAKSSSGTANPSTIYNSETVTFTGSVITSGTTTVKNYRWVIYNDNNKSVYDSGTKSSTSKEFSLSRVGKSSLGSAGTYTVELTITDSNGISCTDTYTFTIDGPNVEITRLDANNTYVTNGESSAVLASFTLSEGGVLDADEIADSFSFEFGSSSYVEDDGTVLVSFTNSKKTTGIVKIGIKGKAAGSTRVTIASDLYDDEIEKTVYVLAPPSVTTDYKTNNHTVKFTIPTYLGSVYSPNMGVTGYRLLIYQGDTLKKALDRVTTTSKEIEVNVEEILDKIDLTGDSYTFKLGIQPIGKCDWGTSDVSDAMKSTKDVPMVAKTSDITAYKVSVTAGADVIVEPAFAWGLPGQKITLNGKSIKNNLGADYIVWKKYETDSVLLKGATYIHTVSTITNNNKLVASIGIDTSIDTMKGAVGSKKYYVIDYLSESVKSYILQHLSDSFKKKDLDALEKGAKLNVFGIAKLYSSSSLSNSKRRTFKNNLERGYAVAQYYDISMKAKVGNRSAKKIQPGGYVDVTLPLPKSLKGAKILDDSCFSIMHILEDGTVEILPCDYNEEEKCVVFQTESFSYFALVYEKAGVKKAK